MTYLARRIFDLRTQRNLKQDELAEALGVSRQAVSKWEMGTGTPTLENLVAISSFFGVSLDSLVKDPSPAEAEIPPQPEYCTEISGKKETPQQTKTLINAAILVAAYLFSHIAVNGIQVFIAQLTSRYSREALVNCLKAQPFMYAVINLIFSAPLYYFMTAAFRDGAYIPSLGRGYKSRLPDVIALWLVSVANLAVSDFLPKYADSNAYYLAAPFLNCAVYLVFYLILTRAKGFDRRANVLLPALGVIFAAAAAFTLIIAAIDSNDGMSTGERLMAITMITRLSNSVTSIVSLISLTLLYDRGRKDI